MSGENSNRFGIGRRSVLKTAGAVAAGGVLSAGAVGTAAAAGDTGWTQRQFDAGKTGYCPGIAAPVGDITVDWTAESPDWNFFNRTDHQPYLSTQIVVDGTVYVGTESDEIFAYDAQNGSVQWSTSINGNAEALAYGDGTLLAAGQSLYGLDPTDGSQKWQVSAGSSGLAVADGTVYAGGGSVVAVDIASGTEQWRYSTGDGSTQPAVADGTVYTVAEGTVHAIDAADGSTAWTETLADSTLGVGPAVTVADGTVFVAITTGFERSIVHALDAQTGSIQWDNPMGRVVTDQAYADGSLFVVEGNGNRLKSLDAATGSGQWSTSTAYSIEGAPTVANGHVYIGLDLDASSGGRLIAVDADTGSKAFTFDSAGKGDSAGDTTGIFTPPTLRDGAIFLTSGDRLYRLSGDTGGGTAPWTQRQFDAGKTGHNPDASPPTSGVSTVWTAESPDWNFFNRTDHQPYLSTQIVVDGTVYVGTESDEIFAYDAQNGSLQWSTGINGNAEALAYADDTLLAAGQSLYGLDPADGSQKWQVSAGSSGLAVADGTVYAGGSSIVAVDIASGTEQWRYSTDDGSTQPAVADGTVYTVAKGTVHAIDASSGAAVWTETLADSTLGIGPAVTVADGTVFVAITTGFERSIVHALDAQTGSIQWDNPMGRVVTDQAYADGSLFVVEGNGNRLRALDASTGSGQWSTSTAYSIEGAPTVANGHVYIGLDLDASSGGRLIAVDADTGSKAFTFDTAGKGDSAGDTTGIFTPPSLQGSSIFLTSGDRLYRLE